MANEHHLMILGEGVQFWNNYRAHNLIESPDLSKWDFSDWNLSGANLYQADFSGSNLCETEFIEADLRHTIFRGCNARRANFSHANLFYARFGGTREIPATKMNKAILSYANLSHADLSGADVREAKLSGVLFGNTDLRYCHNLGTCEIKQPAFIDFHTLKRSWPVDSDFLRAVGLPPEFIEFIHAFFQPSEKGGQDGE